MLLILRIFMYILMIYVDHNLLWQIDSYLNFGFGS